MAQNALVIGLGKSGLAVAALLRALGWHVRGYDRAELDCPGFPGELFVGLDQPPAEAFSSVDVVVLSPGVPPAPILQRVLHYAPHATVHGETSLALSLAAAHLGRIPTVLITGTNGKSTVTALTGALLEAGGLRPFVGGNLGVPLSAELLPIIRGEKPAPTSLVLECSSFQLETMTAVSTDVAMILNVTPDHLDRYESMTEYATTKGRIFAGLAPTGLAVLAARDPWTPHAIACIPLDRRVVLVGGHEPPRIEGEGMDAVLQVEEGETYPRSSLRLAGRHNAENALFALRAARHLGIDRAACQRALADFRGLPHRMQWIRELDGVTYYDDSKATNVASVLAGLDGFERPFVLICGGRAKGDDVTPLRDVLRNRCRALITIGEAAELFAAVGNDIVQTERAPSLKDAVVRAHGRARAGDAVVLSPGCASYDMFRNYVHRGQVFADAVRSLK